MAKIPPFFRTEGEPLLNFSVVDFITKTGYVTYYALIDRAEATTLTSNTIESDRSFWRVTSGDVTSGEEYNFDLTFNTSATIKGKLYVTCTYGGQPNNTGTACTSYETIEIFHVTSTGTETSIGTEQTGETFTSGTTASTIYSYRKTFAFDITRRVFKPGEKLRIEVTMNYSLPGGAGSFAAFWFDPMNRSHAGDDPTASAATDLNDQSTNFKVLVPFEIR